MSSPRLIRKITYISDYEQALVDNAYKVKCVRCETEVVFTIHGVSVSCPNCGKIHYWYERV